MIDKSDFESLKEFGKYSSWAVWSEPEDRPKSNTSDLSVFNSDDILNELKTDYVFIGLNISRDECRECWSNFHSPSPSQNDYKLRYAFKETEFWGSYMTDFFKGYPQSDSRAVLKELKGQSEKIMENVEKLKTELRLFGHPKVIAFGNATYELCVKYLPSFEVYKLRHYSAYCSKERYRKYVESLIEEIHHKNRCTG